MTTKEKINVFIECGISQTKIAELAGINKSTLSIFSVFNKYKGFLMMF